MNTYVEFRADFQRPETVYEPTGEELAELLAEGLIRQGVLARKADNDEFQYYVECGDDNAKVELAIGAVVLDEISSDRWSIMLCGPRKSRARPTPASQGTLEILNAVNRVINESDRIADIRWYPYSDTPERLSLIPHSGEPALSPDFLEQVHPLIRIDWALSKLLFPGWTAFCVLSAIAFSMESLWSDLESRILRYAFWTALVSFFASPIVLGFLIRRASKQRLNP